jgi:sterol desaturase/sphingolipid hydroxylase (fatty acid hydroxylase superfamily)
MEEKVDWIVHSFGFYWLAFFGIILVRYFLVAGGAYWLFYSVLGKSIAQKSLRRSPPMNQSIYREIEMSVLSAVVFALGAAFVITEYDWGITLLYANLHQHDLWYFGVSFVAVLILQDAYFYFLHRLFHNPLLFKWIHGGHHRSGAPTPWTSFAFDLPEAFIQALFFVGVVLIIPLHFIVLISVLMTMTVWSVWNHLGYEIFPPAFRQHWLGRWLIGSTHHAIHHRQYTVHYGLYFTFWDKMCGTQDPHYQNEFDFKLAPKLHAEE